MKLIKAIIRPHKLEETIQALAGIGVDGMTVLEVRGHGKQKGHTAIYRGTEYEITLLPKMMVEVMVPDDLLNESIEAIVKAGRTGHIGDGRIFVLPVEEVYTVRTGEREVEPQLTRL